MAGATLEIALVDKGSPTTGGALSAPPPPFNPPPISREQREAMGGGPQSAGASIANRGVAAAGATAGRPAMPSLGDGEQSAAAPSRKARKRDIPSAGITPWGEEYEGGRTKEQRASDRQSMLDSMSDARRKSFLAKESTTENWRKMTLGEKASTTVMGSYNAAKAAGAAGSAGSITGASSAIMSASAAGPVGVALGALAVGVGAAALGAKKFVDVMDEQSNRLKSYSPELAMATGRNEIRQMMSDFSRAQRIGPQVARFEDLKGRFEQRVSELLTQILELLLKHAEKMEPAAEEALRILPLIPDALEALWVEGEMVLAYFTDAKAYAEASAKFEALTARAAKKYLDATPELPIEDPNVMKLLGLLKGRKPADVLRLGGKLPLAMP